MISAWHSTQHLKLGLFSDAEANWCPLAPDETSKNEMKPFKPENIEAHDLWIKFIQERIEIAKYCSQEQIFMFSHMLQRTLDIGRYNNSTFKNSREKINKTKIFPGKYKNIFYIIEMNFLPNFCIHLNYSCWMETLRQTRNSG